MTTNGPVEAGGQGRPRGHRGPWRPAFGDLDWLAQGLKRFYVSEKYVHEKVELGELGPHTDIPIRVSLGRYGTTIIEDYPKRFFRSIATNPSMLPATLPLDYPMSIVPGTEYVEVYSNRVRRDQ